MADVVERLRAVTEDDAYASPWTFGETCREAAAEIETLRAERSALVAVNDRLVRSAESLRTRLSQAGAGGGVVARDFAGCCEPHDDVERTISIVRAAYDWQVSTDGILCGLVAGDMGYASTHIQLNLNELPNATPPATPVQPTASVEAMAWRDVIAERHRQVEDEGWVPEHGDEHSRGEMARAAACYADPVNIERETPPARWPWDEQWWKPAGQRRMLVKAGALIIAEIERLDRKNGLASLTPAPTQGDGVPEGCPPVGTFCGISGANSDFNDKRTYTDAKVIAYTPDGQFGWFQKDGCWPWQERLANCRFRACTQEETRNA